jgi:hypothetical protein
MMDAGISDKKDRFATEFSSFKKMLHSSERYRGPASEYEDL